jgi:hypothetical protein
MYGDRVKAGQVQAQILLFLAGYVNVHDKSKIEP